MDWCCSHHQWITLSNMHTNLENIEEPLWYSRCIDAPTEDVTNPPESSMFPVVPTRAFIPLCSRRRALLAAVIFCTLCSSCLGPYLLHNLVAPGKSVQAPTNKASVANAAMQPHRAVASFVDSTPAKDMHGSMYGVYSIKSRMLETGVTDASADQLVLIPNDFPCWCNG